MEITNEYLNSLKKNKHKYYDATVKHCEQMKVHVEGKKPDALLDIYRPNEDERIKKYRLSIWEAVTKSFSDRVVTTTNRIFNPQLFSINFPEPPAILGQETLEAYLTEDYPFYRSFINYIQETLISKTFAAPSGFMVIEPLNYDVTEGEYFKPMPSIYEPEYVLDFDLDNYLVVGEPDKWIKVYTRNKIQKYVLNKKSTGKSEWSLTFEYIHNFDFVPALRLKGQIKGDKFPYYYESFIAGVLPHWNKVINLTSDLDAGYVNHLYLERWEYETDCDAPSCKGGLIEVENPDGSKAKVNCKTCNGKGKVSRSPYGVHTIRRDALTPDAPLPTPPAGYIDKPIDIITKVEERIREEAQSGYAAINLDILNKVGEDQSGVAKSIDRQDMDSFFSKIANYVYGFVMPEAIFMTAVWRYGKILNGKIDQILPTIDPPKDFSILSLDFLTNEYKTASTANVSGTYIKGLELEINNIKNKNNEDKRLLNMAAIKLQPFPKKSVDELMAIRSMYPDLSWKVYMSLSIDELVNKAYEIDNTFIDKPVIEQRAIIEQLAKDDTAKAKINLIPSA